MASFIFDKARRVVEAYTFAKRAAEIAPSLSAVWINVGKTADALYQIDEARTAYERALRFASDDDQRLQIYNNWSAALAQAGRFVEAEPLARKALQIDPDHRKARGNLGLCCLATGRWREGWPLYDQIIGSDYRKRIVYANEPAWDGTPGLTVAITGEQGLGDELSFASMVPDAMRDCERVILDCDSRLVGLFRRSFPGATVHGTRWTSELDWPLGDQNIDASCNVGALGCLYRNAASDFPGTPYLVADPDRRLMWRALFDAKNRPCIGVAWTGGVQWTGSRFRKLTLDELLPVFRAVPGAHWVCLQYKDAKDEIAAFRAAHPEIDLVQYPHATLTKDYDDTAGIVAALDYVVSMQTSVIHLAGALGTPTSVFVNRFGQWRYGIDGEAMPWYSCVRIYRQAAGGEWPLAQCAAALAARFA